MTNVIAKVEGDLLVLTVDLTVEGEKSKSGKSTLVASSRGNQAVPGHENVKFGLNVFRS